MNEYQSLQANLQSDVEKHGPTSYYAKRRQHLVDYAKSTVKQFTVDGTLDPLALAVVINEIHTLVAELDDRIDTLERHR
jgi:hypothetical protein